MRGQLRVFDSFEEAEEADHRYYASLTPRERVDLVLDLVARYWESKGEATGRLERIYRVVELGEG